MHGISHHLSVVTVTSLDRGGSLSCCLVNSIWFGSVIWRKTTSCRVQNYHHHHNNNNHHHHNNNNNNNKRWFELLPFPCLSKQENCSMSQKNTHDNQKQWPHLLNKNHPFFLKSWMFFLEQNRINVRTLHSFMKQGTWTDMVPGMANYGREEHQLQIL